ncbi:MAG: flagellar biosynthetic protein FliO [Leptospiraceae bacterium]|nr:flagellar biosynthetic protein FliO [Leptospiraceae bacterium]
MSQTEDQDKELRKQLGVEEKESKKEKSKSGVKEEVNPVAERYLEKEESGSVLLWILVRVTIVLAILVGAAYYGMRFINKNQAARFPVKGAIKVLSSVSIGPGKQIQIIEVSGILLIVGVSEHSITLIKEIDSQEIKQKLVLEADSFQPPNENFLDALFNITKREFSSVKEKKSVENSDEEMMEEVKQRQINYLEKIKKDREELERKNK